jgi:hypothetical protein
MAMSLGKGAMLLIGIDRIKAEDRLVAAYNDNGASSGLALPRREQGPARIFVESLTAKPRIREQIGPVWTKIGPAICLAHVCSNWWFGGCGRREFPRSDNSVSVTAAAGFRGLAAIFGFFGSFSARQHDDRRGLLALVTR